MNVGLEETSSNAFVSGASLRINQNNQTKKKIKETVRVLASLHRRQEEGEGEDVACNGDQTGRNSATHTPVSRSNSEVWNPEMVPARPAAKQETSYRELMVAEQSRIPASFLGPLSAFWYGRAASPHTSSSGAAGPANIPPCGLVRLQVSPPLCPRTHRYMLWVSTRKSPT